MTSKEMALVVKTIAWTLFFMVFGWCVWSYLDVIAHQNCGGTQNALNLFRLMV